MDLVFRIFVYSWIISIFFGIIVAISYPIFIDNADERFEVFVPLYNLFGFCSFNGYYEKFGLLFLIPFVNIAFMMFMCYKLKEKFGLSTAFGVGLILLPIVFMPILAYSKKYRNVSESYTSEETADIEDTTVVAKIKKVEKTSKTKNKKESEELVDDTEVFDENALSDDDSIFKLQSKTQEVVNNKPYKAKRVRVNEEFINSAPAEREKIEKVEKGKN